MLADAGEDPALPESDRFDIPVALVGTVFFIVLYLLMMDLVMHNWVRVVILAASVVAGSVFLYLTWWRRLERT
jgi:uncharacterized membrane protein